MGRKALPDAPRPSVTQRPREKESGLQLRRPREGLLAELTAKTGRVTGVYTEPGHSESGRVHTPARGVGEAPGAGDACRASLAGLESVVCGQLALCPPPSAHTVPTVPPPGVMTRKASRRSKLLGEVTTESLPAEKLPHRAGPDVNPSTTAERTQRGRLPRGGQGGCPGCCPLGRDVGAPIPTRAGPSGETSPPWVLGLRPRDHTATLLL